MAGGRAEISGASTIGASAGSGCGATCAAATGSPAPSSLVAAPSVVAGGLVSIAAAGSPASSSADAAVATSVTNVRVRFAAWRFAGAFAANRLLADRRATNPFDVVVSFRAAVAAGSGVGSGITALSSAGSSSAGPSGSGAGWACAAASGAPPSSGKGPSGLDHWGVLERVLRRLGGLVAVGRLDDVDGGFRGGRGGTRTRRPRGLGCRGRRLGGDRSCRGRLRGRGGSLRLRLGLRGSRDLLTRRSWRNVVATGLELREGEGGCLQRRRRPRRLGRSRCRRGDRRHVGPEKADEPNGRKRSSASRVGREHEPVTVGSRRAHGHRS